MLHRNPACHRAVQRQLLSPFDSIWISDSLLRSTYESFFSFSKSYKRHGSFVPGPLECRRRLGKRRMAHMTATFPHHEHGVLNWLWSWWAGDIDNNQWQWKAPRSCPPLKVPVSIELDTKHAPGWPSPESSEDTSSKDLHAETDTSAQTISFGEEDISRFRANLRIFHGSRDSLKVLCKAFNHQLQRSIALGIVDEFTLYRLLEDIPKCIEESLQQPGDGLLQYSSFTRAQLVDLYCAIWYGITECSSFQPLDLQPIFMDRLLGLVANTSARVSMSLKSRTLAHKILKSASNQQLEGMDTSIHSLVLAWSNSWKRMIYREYSVDLPSQMRKVGRDVLKFSKATRQLQKWLKYSERSIMSRDDIEKANRLATNARTALTMAMDAVQEADRKFWIYKKSITELADALKNIRQDKLHAIVLSSEILNRFPENTLSETRRKQQYNWLSLVAQLPDSSGLLLLEVWRSMPADLLIPQAQISDLILTYWSSQGISVRYPSALRNKLEAQGFELGDLAILLISSLEEQDEPWERAANIFNFMDVINKHQIVSRVLAHLKELGMIPPVTLLRQILGRMSKYDPINAFRILNLYTPNIINIKMLEPELCSEIILASADHPIPPKRIWKTMGIPLYADLKPSAKRKLSREPLDPKMISLITNIATVFSSSTARPQRVALRNVTQCLYHLRRHKAPLTAEMARAISRASVTREIPRENRVGTERLKWTLSLVEKAEGTQVAETVDKAVWHWRNHLSQKDRQYRVNGRA